MDASAPTILAVIPARGGSKRIPMKNIRDFCDKPMMAWPIAVLNSLDLVSDVIVSTDDPNIMSVAESLGAKAPFVRPEDLSDDFTGTGAVTAHAATWYRDNIGKVDYVLTVYPTAVFLKGSDIEEALEMMTEGSPDMVFSGTEFPFPIQRAVYLSDDNYVTMFQPEHYYSRSQDLTKAYHDAGQFYLATLQAALDETPAFSDKSRMLVLPRYRVVDIDTEEDLATAEKLFQAMAEADRSPQN